MSDDPSVPFSTATHNDHYRSIHELMFEVLPANRTSLWVGVAGILKAQSAFDTKIKTRSIIAILRKGTGLKNFQSICSYADSLMRN